MEPRRAKGTPYFLASHPYYPRFLSSNNSRGRSHVSGGLQVNRHPLHLVISFFFAKKSPLLYAVLGVYWPSSSLPLSLSPPQAFYSFYPIDYVILLLPPLNLGFESVTACCKSSPRRQFIESAVSFIFSIAPVCRQESLCSSQFSSETLQSVAFAFGSCVLHPSWSILHHLPASYKLILISPLVSASL